MLVERFHLPPVVHNDAGHIRRAGFEFEYAGLDIAASARLVREVFGGDVQVQSTFVHLVHAPLGTFSIEIDTSLLKDKKYESVLRAVGLDPAELNMQPLESMLVDVFSTIIPFEISTPPIPLTELARMDELRQRLHDRRAEGTKAGWLNAFGMHINPEVPSLQPQRLLDYLRAFVLIGPWIEQRVDVDIARRLSPYVNPFPDEYVQHILRDDYRPDAVGLIDDYLAWNPTRNRPLDMLPVLAMLDAARVSAGVHESKHLVKGRPAFHYRYPNCLIDDPTWTIAREWNTWLAVERAAADERKIGRMMHDWRRAREHPLRLINDRWPAILVGYLEG